MTTESLPVVMENLEEELAIIGQEPAATAGLAHATKVCQCYRRLGICNLFLLCDPSSMREFLRLSGRYYLEFTTAAADEAQSIGTARGFLDAIGAGDWETVEGIASGASRFFNRDFEYEEDFIYFRFLMDLIVEAKSKQELAAELTKFEEIVDGDPAPRLDIARALLSGDGPELDEALVALLAEHGQFYRESMEADELPEDDWATEGYLSVEGLAVLMLARRLGIPMNDNYPFVPSIALPAEQ